uniref:Calcyon neuron specific vesicular protein n=1 Tax=Spermophilus dauricus TaxID=99837 RepID=A0A8C9NZH2_SPEDA
MVKLGCSFSGKPGKDPGDQDGAATDSVPLISPLDVSQLQPPFPDQVVIKTQTEYQLSSPDQPKKFPDLEGQRLSCGHPEEGRRLPTARMIAFAMAFLGCVLIMYKAIWYDQFTCPDGFLLRVRPEAWAGSSRNHPGPCIEYLVGHEEAAPSRRGHCVPAGAGGALASRGPPSGSPWESPLLQCGPDNMDQNLCVGSRSGRIHTMSPSQCTPATHAPCPLSLYTHHVP